MKKAVCVALIAAMVLSLAGCDANGQQQTSIPTVQPETSENSSMTSENTFGVDYKIPKGWISEKSDSGVNYYPAGHTGDAMVQVIFSETTGIDTDTARDFLDSFADGLKESDFTNVSSFTSTIFDVPVGHANRTEAAMDVDGTVYSVEMYCTPIQPTGQDTGIFSILLATAPRKDYSDDFAAILSSVDVSSVPLPLGTDPSGCDTTKGALSGDTMPDAVADLYASLREEYGNHCFVDCYDGTIAVGYWDDSFTQETSKLDAWANVVKSVSYKYQILRNDLDLNGCDMPLLVELVDSTDPSKSLVDVTADGVTYDIATDSDRSN